MVEERSHKVVVGSVRQQLLEFLDANIFQPALRADPSGYTAAGQRKLQAGVQKAVRATYVRYHQDYKTATEVKDRFFQDLNSPAGKALAADMWQLKLKAFEDYVPQFRALCKQLGL